MIELLKSVKINNRLLCELATHEGFRKLTDLEIYVDRITSMQLSNLNAIVDMARIEIEKKYNPDAEDQYIQTLKAAHIDEDNYFSHMIRLGKGLKKLPISKVVQKKRSYSCCVTSSVWTTRACHLKNLLYL